MKHYIALNKREKQREIVMLDVDEKYIFFMGTDAFLFYNPDNWVLIREIDLYYLSLRLANRRV